MKAQIFCFILFISGTLCAQHKIAIEENAGSGTGRTLSILHNQSNGHLGFSGMEWRSGPQTNFSQGSITQTHSDYTGIPDWESYLSIWSGSSGSAFGNGINMVAFEGNANIRFYTRGAQPTNLRMILDGEGRLGLGTGSPSARFEVKQGDIFLSDHNAGVIMTSPSGYCFQMTVNDDGEPVFSKLDPCPSP